MRQTALRLAGAGLVVAALGLACCAAAADPQSADDPWPDIARDAFNGRPLTDGTGLLTIEMPYRAEDAAIVPVTIRSTLAPGDGRYFKSFTLIIDQNPSPVAATFRIGPDAGISSISTRVRVNSYTDVHLVGELSDGKLYQVKTFVKASGGCSAPAVKNPDEVAAHIGEMRFRQFRSADAAAGPPLTAQIMIRHPNNSGLQMDQVTRLYIPAFFVEHLALWQGDAPLLSVDGGISISEDPNFRFTYVPNGARSFRAEARDTSGHVFKGEWPVEQSQM